MIKMGWDKLRKFLSESHTWTGIQTFANVVIQAGTIAASVVIDLVGELTSPPPIGKTTPAELWGSPNVSKGPAIINAPAGTVTATASTTVVFSDVNTAILAGYSATNPIVGTTVISNALTRYIISWTNATTCVVDSAVTWVGTAITSLQLPIAFKMTSAGVLKEAWYSGGVNVVFSSAAPTTCPADGAIVVVVDYVAGDARWNFMSEASLEKVIIGNGQIAFNANLLSDHTATGRVLIATAGENLVFGDNCYLKSDGKWWKTDADAEATMPGTMMATGTISANATGIFLIEGWARDDSAWAGMTIGSPIYTSQTAGAITQTAPTPTASATVCIQTVGKAPSTNTATVGIIRYSPEQNFVVAGVDIIDYAAADGAITPAGLTAVPIQFLGDHSSTQTFTLGALTSADVGKKFEVVKKGTGAGVLRLQLPAGTYCHSSGASSSAAGTVTLPVSAYGSFGVRVTSATTIQIYAADCVGGLTFA
jgi:hypothetical protein